MHRFSHGTAAANLGLAQLVKSMVLIMPLVAGSIPGWTIHFRVATGDPCESFPAQTIL